MEKVRMYALVYPERYRAEDKVEVHLETGVGVLTGQQGTASEARPNVPHHLAGHFIDILAHYAANFVITTLFSTSYEGRDTCRLGVVLTARQLNPARCCEGLKYCHFAVHAVPVADDGIPHTRSHR
jgi:hypothetical protein